MLSYYVDRHDRKHIYPSFEVHYTHTHILNNVYGNVFMLVRLLMIPLILDGAFVSSIGLRILFMMVNVCIIDFQLLEDAFEL